MDKNSVYYKYEEVEISMPHENIRNNKFAERGNFEVLFRLLVKYFYDNELIDSSKNIIDLGAWIGDNSIAWSKQISGKVYSIDPSEANIKYIDELSKLNNLSNNITINKCISDREKEIYSNDDFYDSEYTSTAVFNTKKGKNKTLATSLDNLYKSATIENIGFIHLDVEGFEQAVLAGSIDILAKYKPVIIWENHLKTDNFEKIIKFLRDQNYNSFLINEKFAHTRKDCRNFLSIPIESEISKNIDVINDHFKNLHNENRADELKPILINISKNTIQVLLKTLKISFSNLF